jgi:hypothetical protein
MNYDVYSTIIVDEQGQKPLAMPAASGPVHQQ